MKSTITAIGIVLALTSQASACLSLQGGTFYNNCGEKLIFTFKTIGGGCFVRGYGSETVSAYSSVQTAAGMECGGAYPQRVEWVYCPYDAWVDGSCSARLN